MGQRIIQAVTPRKVSRQRALDASVVAAKRELAEKVLAAIDKAFIEAPGHKQREAQVQISDAVLSLFTAEGIEVERSSDED